MNSVLTVSPDWQAIRMASIRGVPDKTLAESFGVTRAAIRKRRERERWPGGAKKAPPPLTESRSLAASGEAAEAIATASLAEIGERNALLIAREVAKLIQRTFAGGMIQAPGTWPELVQAHKMLESATGRNKSGAVTVSVGGMAWGSGYQQREKPIIIVETKAATMNTQQVE